MEVRKCIIWHYKLIWLCCTVFLPNNINQIKKTFIFTWIFFKLEKKQSFVAASEKEPVRNNGDVAVHENGDATVSASATANGKTVESKVEDKRKKSTSSSSSSGMTQTYENIKNITDVSLKILNNKSYNKIILFWNM